MIEIEEHVSKYAQGEMHCAYCGKGQGEIAHLILGPRCDLHICNECVAICADIVGYRVWERDTEAEAVPGCRR